MLTRSSDPREKRWARLHQTRASRQLEAIEILSSNIFAPQQITFDRATAVVGSHGTGKSLLLKLIEAAFGDSSWGPMPPFVEDHPAARHEPDRILNARMDVTVRANNEEKTVRIDLASTAAERCQIWGEALDPPIFPCYTSPTEAFSLLQLFYQEYDFIMRRSEAGSAFEYARDDLNGMYNILAKRYDSVTVESVAFDSGDDAGELPDLFGPHVVASMPSGGNVNISMMSLGEIWVHYVLGWVMRQAQREPVLMDEVESFLAARGHRPFIDEIARVALKQDQQIIVATHAADILARFPLGSMRMCVPSSNGTRVVVPSSIIQVRDAVGIVVPVRALVLLEDEFAAKLLMTLFGYFDVALARETEIVRVGGASEVVSGTRILAGAQRVPCIGVLDGDEKDRQNVAKVSDLRILFLPGHGQPEAELADAVARNLATAAEDWGRTTDDIVAALYICEGLDHQYWPAELARQLGHDQAVILRTLVKCWLSDREIRADAEALVAQLRAVVDQQRR